MVPRSDLLDAARAVQPRTVALRRTLHRHPELGLDLPRTRDAVVAEVGLEGGFVVVGAVHVSCPGVWSYQRAGRDWSKLSDAPTQRDFLSIRPYPER